MTTDRNTMDDILALFARVGTTEDPSRPKVFKDFHEYTVSQIANSDITDPALYVLLTPTYSVKHVGISKNLCERMKMHIHNPQKSNLKFKARSEQIQDPKCYKIRFMRWSNVTLEKIEKFILICFREGKQS